MSRGWDNGTSSHKKGRQRVRECVPFCVREEMMSEKAHSEGKWEKGRKKWGRGKEKEWRRCCTVVVSLFSSEACSHGRMTNLHQSSLMTLAAPLNTLECDFFVTRSWFHHPVSREDVYSMNGWKKKQQQQTTAKDTETRSYKLPQWSAFWCHLSHFENPESELKRWCFERRKREMMKSGDRKQLTGAKEKHK